MEVIAVLLEQLPKDPSNGGPAPAGTPTPAGAATPGNAPADTPGPYTPAGAMPPAPVPAPAGDAWQQYLSPTFLAQLLLSRCSDKAPT